MPYSKCGWFHRRTLEQVRAESEAVRAAKKAERRRKQKYAVGKATPNLTHPHCFDPKNFEQPPFDEFVELQSQRHGI